MKTIHFAEAKRKANVIITARENNMVLATIDPSSAKVIAVGESTSIDDDTTFVINEVKLVFHTPESVDAMIDALTHIKSFITKDPPEYYLSC